MHSRTGFAGGEPRWMRVLRCSNPFAYGYLAHSFPLADPRTSARCLCGPTRGGGCGSVETRRKRWAGLAADKRSLLRILRSVPMRDRRLAAGDFRGVAVDSARGVPMWWICSSSGHFGHREPPPGKPAAGFSRRYSTPYRTRLISDEVVGWCCHAAQANRSSATGGGSGGVGREACSTLLGGHELFLAPDPDFFGWPQQYGLVADGVALPSPVNSGTPETFCAIWQTTRSRQSPSGPLDSRNAWGRPETNPRWPGWRADG